MVEQQTLYRKYRPKTFDDVRGQDAIVRTLKNQVKHGTNVQAYLFCGTRGTGKTSVAKIFARAINCENMQDGNPCNTCDTCTSIFDETNPDVYEIDAASNAGVENARQIKKDIAYPPKMSKYRVYIIDEAHALTKEAFNALLKTLEEPPEYVIFILATTDPQSLPNTILSRLQRYEFRRIDTEVIIDTLKNICEKESISAEDIALEEIALRAEGSMRDAISFLDRLRPLEGQTLTLDQVKKVFGESDIQEYKQVVDAFYAENIEQALILLKNSLKQGKEETVYINGLMQYMRNLLIAKKTEHSERFIETSKENLEIIKNQSKTLDHAFLIRIIFLLADASAKIRNDTAKRILLETTFIKICLTKTENTNNAIQARLASVERIVAGLKNGTLQTQENSTKNINAQNTTNKEQNGQPIETTQKPYVNTIVLPKENIEIYKLLQKDWRTIISQFGFPYSIVLEKAILIPDKNDPHSFIVQIGYENYLEDLQSDEIKNKFKEICLKRYQMEIKFSFVEKYNIKKDYSYVTEEDIAQINFDVKKEA